MYIKSGDWRMPLGRAYNLHHEVCSFFFHQRLLNGMNERIVNIHQIAPDTQTFQCRRGEALTGV